MEIKEIFKHCEVHKIFGTAGSGKTTFLIKELNKLFEQGVRPERIAFVSFTRKAVEELISRSIKKFVQFDKKNFTFFTTIHAMCYAEIKLQNKELIQQKELKSVANSMGLKISSYNSMEDGFSNKKDDKIIQIESLARLRMVDLKEQCEKSKFQDCPLFIVKDWRKKINNYKKENNLIDFTDMLEMYDSFLNVDYLFIDEAQDLCPLQWKVMNKASKNCKKVYIAGDDDQSIFNWAGADIKYILNVKTDKETILSTSHRLPIVIHNLSKQILKKIKIRKNKNSVAFKKEGKIKRLLNFEQITFDKKQEYLILVRNRWQIKNIETFFIEKGIPFISKNKNYLDLDCIKAIVAWEKSRKNKIIEEVGDFIKIKKYSTIMKGFCKKQDVDKSLFDKPWYIVFNLIENEIKFYLRLVLKNGYKITEIPKIRISTIHQSKGGECDNVVLFKDISFLVWKNKNSDFEHKVWYVAITRSKKNLFIIKEQSNKFYNI